MWIKNDNLSVKNNYITHSLELAMNCGRTFMKPYSDFEVDYFKELLGEVIYCSNCGEAHMISRTTCDDIYDLEY